MRGHKRCFECKKLGHKADMEEHWVGRGTTGRNRWFDPECWKTFRRHFYGIVDCPLCEGKGVVHYGIASGFEAMIKKENECGEQQD